MTFGSCNTLLYVHPESTKPSLQMGADVSSLSLQ
ncbi:hypothetical protein GBAR_LOCUS13939 [Geodia barretti]|uniref:Uncharacterized protein n=1 Tax=Geodia barretti TaxID=519541 RepID=A0AA35S637_GEOBA|nr:hypothetical protein GBAR_LOCUS13939 [Geodia barretti]